MVIAGAIPDSLEEIINKIEPFNKLKERLHSRLSKRGVEITDVIHEEHCLFPMNLPLPYRNQPKGNKLQKSNSNDPIDRHIFNHQAKKCLFGIPHVLCFDVIDTNAWFYSPLMCVSTTCGIKWQV